MPVGGPREALVGHLRVVGGLGHLRRAEVRAVGEDGGVDGSVAAECAVRWSAGDIDERGFPCSVSGAAVRQLDEMAGHR